MHNCSFGIHFFNLKAHLFYRLPAKKLIPNIKVSVTTAYFYQKWEWTKRWWAYFWWQQSSWPVKLAQHVRLFLPLQLNNTICKESLFSAKNWIFSGNPTVFVPEQNEPMTVIFSVTDAERLIRLTLLDMIPLMKELEQPSDYYDYYGKWHSLLGNLNEY